MSRGARPASELLARRLVAAERSVAQLSRLGRSVIRDADASRPAAGDVRPATIFVASDTGRVSISDGVSAWTLLACPLDYCRLTRSAALGAVANTTWTTLAMDTVYGDPLSMLDGGGGATPKIAGTYRVMGCVTAPASVGAVYGWTIMSRFWRGGTTQFGEASSPIWTGSASHANLAIDDVVIGAGTSIQLQAWQNSGAGLTPSIGAVNCWLSVAWMAP